MVTPLQKVHLLVEDAVYQPVGSGDPARPDGRAEKFKGFRFSDAPERITEDRLHQIEKAEGEGTIRFRPSASPAAVMVRSLIIPNGMTWGPA